MFQATAKSMYINNSSFLSLFPCVHIYIYMYIAYRCLISCVCICVLHMYLNLGNVCMYARK